MKSVLITGAAGFIGSHLSEYFLKQNHAVFGLDNFCTGTQANIDILKSYPNFHFTQHDVCDSWQSLHEAWLQHDFKLVFHLASPAAVNQYQNLNLETMWANSIGLKNALEFATNHKSRLIFSSTSEIYGSPDISPQAETYWGKVNSFGERSCYDEAKRFGESLIYHWNLRHKTQHGLVRIFNTYGPRMNPADGRVLIQFLRQAHNKMPLSIYGNGLQTRSFCYIDDLIKGLVAYAHSSLTKPINLGNDAEISIKKLAEEVVRALELELKSELKSKSELELEPELKFEAQFEPQFEPKLKVEPKFDFSDLPADDPPQRKPDLALARQLLQYEPTVSLVEGIRKLYKAEFK